MAQHKYQLMTRDEYGHWTLMDIFSLTNSKKDIIDQLERCYSYKGATHIKNIDRGDILDMEVTWQNLFGQTIKKTFSYRWQLLGTDRSKTVEQAIKILKKHKYDLYSNQDEMYIFTTPKNTLELPTMVAMSEATVIRKAQQLEDDGA